MRALLAALALLAASPAAAQPARPPAAAPAAPTPGAPAPGATAPATPAPDKPQALAVETVVPLKGPGGPWGPPAIDDPSRRLFLPRGPAGVVVLGLDGFKPAGEVADTAGSGAVALDGETLRGFSADTLAEGGGTAIVAFDLRTLKPVGKLALPKVAHIAMDVATRHLLALDQDGTLHMVDPVKMTVAGTITVEGKRLAALGIDRRGRALVLAADRNAVVVLDLVARRVAATWTLGPCRNPVTMLFETFTFRLLVGCRGVPPGPPSPTGAPGTPGAEPMGLMLDGHSGATLSNMPVPNLMEAFISDPQRRVVFVTSGLSASLMVHRMVDFNRFEPIEVAGTRPLAASGVMDTRTGRLILPWADYAVPLVKGETAPKRRYQPNGGALLVMKRVPLD